jgi:hypothetical protein
MLRSHRTFGLFFIISALLFTACSAAGSHTPTTNPQAIYTSAAQTVGAELTQSGALTPSVTFTPTATQTQTQVTVSTTAAPTETIAASTQPPTSSPTTAKLPDRAEFVSQAVADGTKFSPGQTIKMSWVIKNIGTTNWTTSYTARYYAGDFSGTVSTVALPKEIKPGEQLQINVDFTVPDTLGKKSSIWVLQNANGINFYPFYLNIDIIAATPTQTPPPATSTFTPQPTATITPTSEPSTTPTTTTTASTSP